LRGVYPNEDAEAAQGTRLSGEMSPQKANGGLFSDEFRLYSVAAKRPEPQMRLFASIRYFRQRTAPMTWPEATYS
jgi:hypothetical protein